VPSLSRPAERFPFRERLLTPKEVGDQLGVSLDWIYDHAGKDLRVVKLSGPEYGRGRSVLRFRQKDIDEFVQMKLIGPDED
jgi:predicted DNA-binding transcriptional regulator AlpA